MKWLIVLAATAAVSVSGSLGAKKIEVTGGVGDQAWALYVDASEPSSTSSEDASFDSTAVSIFEDSSDDFAQLSLNDAVHPAQQHNHCNCLKCSYMAAQIAAFQAYSQQNGARPRNADDTARRIPSLPILP